MFELCCFLCGNYRRAQYLNGELAVNFKNLDVVVAV